LEAAQSRPERAVRLAGATAALREALGYQVWHANRVREQRWLDPLRRSLGDRAEALWAEGRALSIEQALAYAEAPDGPTARRAPSAGSPIRGDNPLSRR